MQLVGWVSWQDRAEILGRSHWTRRPRSCAVAAPERSGSALELPCTCPESALDLPWICPWICPGFAPRSAWICPGPAPGSALDLPLDLPWTCPWICPWICPGPAPGSALDLPWICPGSALDLPWIFPGSSLDLPWICAPTRHLLRPPLEGPDTLTPGRVPRPNGRDVPQHLCCVHWMGLRFLLCAHTHCRGWTGRPAAQGGGAARNASGLSMSGPSGSLHQPKLCEFGPVP